MNALLTALAVLAGVLLANSRIGDRVDQLVEDVAVAYHTPFAAKPHPRVVVVAIDDATIDRLPVRSPIDRMFLADLLRVVAGARPVAIGVDILLTEPGADAAADLALAASIGDAGVPVVLTLGLTGGETKPLAPAFRSAGADVALGNLPVSVDDLTLRHYRTAFADSSGRLHDTLATMLARHAGAEVASRNEDVPIDWYGQPGWQDRRSADGRRVGPQPIAAVSAQSLLARPVIGRLLLTGKVVIIGATFDGCCRDPRTLFAHRGEVALQLPGVLAHGQIVAQLIDGRMRPAVGTSGEILAALVAALVGMALALGRIPALLAVLGAIVAPALWVVAAFYLFRETAVMLPIMAPTVAGWLSLVVFALIRARRGERGG